ncbi:hypothetical protein [Coleofasciculus sp. FACHB-1120]|uniref:hypothetical protein n=1 Tax=Coleofasciculus sp. FACHB-1120 TaxID=2692783 RepID=UPI00168A17D3|nr:hypothetical protein [Coleofasciculus sp. FACHB-1120]MBD2740641.1 hypothetical protein [Coleofasciculus sp. FACHB-1120]
MRSKGIKELEKKLEECDHVSSVAENAIALLWVGKDAIAFSYEMGRVRSRFWY